jgi:putative NADPH-quinone reductase
MEGPAMPKRLLVVDGHPDPDPARFIHALADAYAEAARTAGHDVTLVRLASTPPPVLASAAEWYGPPPAALAADIAALRAADHLAIFYPLWLGAMPALLKAWLEQVMRPDVAMPHDHAAPGKGLLKGKSARIVVTMGMPGFIYRWWFGALTLKSLEQNILAFVGIGPVKDTVIGSIAARSEADRKALIGKLRGLGRDGA